MPIQTDRTTSAGPSSHRGISGRDRDRAALARRRAAATGGLALGLATLGLALLGFNKTRVGAWAVSDLVFLLAGVVICLKLLSGRTADLAPSAMRKSSPPIVVGTLVIVVAGMLSSFQSFEPVASIQMVLRVIWITLAWFWVLRAVSPNRRTLDRLLKGVKFTVVASCLGAMAGYFGLVALTRENPENREAAFFDHPNELGGLLATTMPLIVLGVLDRDGPRDGSTWRRLGFAMLAVFALGTTGSMTAFLSTVASLVAIVGVRSASRSDPGRRRFQTPLPYLFGAFALVLGFIWLASSDLPAVERFTQLGEGGNVSSSVESRGDLNDYVISNLDDSLVIGVGLDANTSFIGTSLDDGVSRIHNMYLKLLYEAGLPGLLGLFIVMATAFRQSWRLVINTRRTDLNPLAIGLFGALVSINVFALFQPLFVQRYYWLPVGLIGLLWSLRRQESREAAEAAELADAAGAGA